MPDFKRTLGLFFQRELRQLRSIAVLRLRRRRKPARERRRAVREDRRASPAAAHITRSFRTVLSRAFGSGGSFAFSALLHCVALMMLAGWWLPEQHRQLDKYGEVSIAIRVVPPIQSTEPPPSEEPSRSPKRDELPGDPEVVELDAPPVPAPEDQDSSGKETVDSEPARGRPVDVSTSLTDLAPPPLPRSLGLGSAPLPLPGSGNGVLRGFSTRGQGKGEALRRHGGGGGTESAVGRGLRWLAEHQDENGGWSADGFQRHCRHFVACRGKGLNEFDVGVTALATLAFLGAGHVPDTPEPSSKNSPAVPAVDFGAHGGSIYSRNVGKALEFLSNNQDGKGAFGAIGDNYMYNHALATLAMSEAYAMTGGHVYRSSLEAAVQFITVAQQSGGGWDYTAMTSGRNDLSITGWQIMALRSAESAGIPVSEGVFQRIAGFLDGAILQDGEGVYANAGQEAGRRGLNMVSVGLLSNIYMGTMRENPRVRRAADRLLRAPPDWQETAEWEKTFQSYYYWYTGSLALFHLGGEPWKEWNLLLLRTLLPLQSQKPHELGSWPPETSWIGSSGGRVYSTAMGVLTLETYYRYEPIFRSRKG